MTYSLSTTGEIHALENELADWLFWIYGFYYSFKISKKLTFIEKYVIKNEVKFEKKKRAREARALLLDPLSCLFRLHDCGWIFGE